MPGFRRGPRGTARPCAAPEALVRRAAGAAALLLLPLLVACGGDKRTPLIVYSPHGRALLSAFEQRFEQLHPDVDVQWIDMGSQEVLDRIRSEKANPQADVWWGAPAALFERAAGEGLLQPFHPAWGDAVPAVDRDSAGRWYGTFLTPEVIAYNSDAVPDSEAPQDWSQVLDPRWKGQVLIRDPLASGTMRTIFGMVIDRSLRETGDTTQGWQWLRRLDAQTKEYVLNPTLLYQKLARREGLITLWDMPDIDELRARTKLPIAYTIPTSGTPLLVDAIAIPKGAPHPALAREFVNFVGGMEGTLMAARQFGRLPARSDVPPDSLPPHLRDALRRIVPEPLDWHRLQEQGPTWMRYWDEHVRGRS